MAMLYELHNQGQDCFVYTCNSCKVQVETRYHCTVCDDFDLCVSCFGKERHPHKMEKVGFDLDDGPSSSDQKQANPQESRRLSIKRCIQSLVHACQCRGAKCRLPSCQKMKRVVIHTNSCKRKQNGGCPICKQLIGLCCYHAKRCKEAKCPVPFCINIKHKLKHQQLQARVHQTQMLKRRISSMQSMSRSITSQAVPGPPPSQPSPAPHPVLQAAAQPVIGTKTATARSPEGAINAIKQVQATVAKIQGPAIGYVGLGKGSICPTIQGTIPSPQLHAQMQKPMNALKPGPNRMMNSATSQWDNRYAQATPPPHPALGIQQGAVQPLWPPIPSQMITPHPQPGQSNPAMGPPAQPSGQRQNQIPHALQQLLQTLKSPTSPHQQQQLLAILKSNPQLMAAFIKRRAAESHQQQQQRQQQQQMQQQHQQGMSGGGMHVDMQGGNMPGGVQGGQILHPLQQLLQILKSPTSPQQQQQLLAILKSNPDLMAAFINRRAAERLQQQVIRQGAVQPHTATHSQPDVDSSFTAWSIHSSH